MMRGTVPESGLVRARMMRGTVPKSGSVRARMMRGTVPESGSVRARMMRGTVPESGSVRVWCRASRAAPAAGPPSADLSLSSSSLASPGTEGKLSGFAAKQPGYWSSA